VNRFLIYQKQKEDPSWNEEGRSIVRFEKEGRLFCEQFAEGRNNFLAAPNLTSLSFTTIYLLVRFQVEVLIPIGTLLIRSNKAGGAGIYYM
jgi:hypothetical protein